MPREPLSLEIRLGSLLVGHLTLLPNEQVALAFSEEYRSGSSRPVLGQFFEPDFEAPRPTLSRVHPFFSNLLPEGALRSLLAKRAGVPENREFYLLATLGEDLPGAVVVRPAGEAWEDLPELGGRKAGQAVPGDYENAPLRFSLAGVQLKFSALREGRGLTVPVSGMGGDWIVKLPDQRFEGVTENEFSIMSWARASGIETAEFDLVRVGEIEGLPVPGFDPESKALAVRRFDRKAAGERIHIEDFAQVLGLFPEQKYDKYNYETIANILWTIGTEDDLEEFLRRLVFIVASGNADAHHKNCSLIYANGRTPALSPAYDLASTILYPLVDDRLALNLARSKVFQDVGIDSLTRLAVRIGAPEAWVRQIVRSAAEQTLDAWPSISSSLEPAHRKRIEDHLATVPLLDRSKLA